MEQRKKMQKVDTLSANCACVVMAIILLMTWAAHDAASEIEKLIEGDIVRHAQRYAADEMRVKRTLPPTPRAATRETRERQQRLEQNGHRNSER